MAHLVKLIQSRTLYLQRVVNANPFDTETENKTIKDVKELTRRLEDLEARTTSAGTSTPKAEMTLNGKQSAVITTEVRRGLQPDLDALNRAVRRYEKRATIQAFQTEARLHELEGRLNDAISLAAAAAKNGQSQRGFTGIIVEWAATAIVLPLQAIGTIARLPFKTLMAIVSYGRGKVRGQQLSDRGRKTINGSGRYSSHGRSGDRVSSSRISKKPLI
jgi:hypothetical protein